MIKEICIKCGGNLRWVRFEEGTEDYPSGLVMEFPQCIQCGKVYFDTKKSVREGVV